MHGDLPALERALAQGANADEPPILLRGDGTESKPSFKPWGSPLLAAASLGKHRSMLALLSAGADPSKKSLDGSGLLLSATRSGSLPCFAMAAMADPHPIAADLRDIDALMIASMAGRPAMVAELLALGLDPNRSTRLAKTALHFACESGSTKTCALLIEAGADASAKDEHGKTPLFYASSRANPDIVPMLLARGASIDETDNLGQSALHQLARKKDTRLSRRLLGLGASARARDSDGITALGMACRYGWAQHILDLAQAGADVSAPGKPGQSGFHIIMDKAPFGQAIEAGMALLQCGANPNARDKDGYSALDRAVRRSPYWTEIILAWGADPNLPHPSTGLSALDSVAFRGGTERLVDLHTAQALLAAGARPSPSLMAAYLQREALAPGPGPRDVMGLVWTRCKIEHERSELDKESNTFAPSARKASL